MVSAVQIDLEGKQCDTDFHHLVAVASNLHAINREQPALNKTKLLFAF